MRTILLASAALASAVLAIWEPAPALSADMPLKAPPVAAATSWSGLYLGGHLGYGYAVTETSLPDLGFSNRFVGLGSRGLTGGVLGGYNVMLTSRWLAGIEGDLSWQSIRHRESAFGATDELKLGWSASIRGRLGYLVTPTTLLFGTLGWTWSRLEFSDNVVPESLAQNVGGVQLGFGVETVLTGNWLARTEYLHSFYGDATFNSQLLGQVNVSPWVGVVRSALIYRFGPDVATPWTDRPVNPIWTGFYLGGLIGPGIANAKLTLAGQPLTYDGIGVAGVLPAAAAGYNVQLAPRWIAGIEGEIAPAISTTDVKVDWTGSVRGRLPDHADRDGLRQCGLGHGRHPGDQAERLADHERDRSRDRFRLGHRPRGGGDGALARPRGFPVFHHTIGQLYAPQQCAAVEHQSDRTGRAPGPRLPAEWSLRPLHAARALV
jgi:outer membrane immunogenic protein